MKKTTKGVLLFAENNNQINYVKLAILCAICVKNNMGKETLISLVTTKSSIKWLKDEDLKLVNSLFDKVIYIPNSDESDNIRIYRDTQYYSVELQFLNKARSSAYSLTPYDETLLIDVDYFVLNGNLNHVWGCEEDFLINKSAKSLLHEELAGQEFRISPFGIRMYWATLIYFKKSEKAELIFNLVEHIKTCWEYYGHVYDFPNTMYRNDYAFSIAIHMLNGFSDDQGVVKSFPDQAILTATDKDQFIDFIDKTTVKFFVNDPAATYKFYVSKLKDVNIHSLNKISILNKYDKILETIK